MKMIGGRYAADTPYAWLVTIAAFTCYAISRGCDTGTAGILYTVFLEEFHVSRGATALLSAMTNVTSLGGGVIAGYMTNRWGSRIVVLLGSTCMGLSFIISSFSLSMTVIYITLGLFRGFAIILMSQPLFIVILNYHLKRVVLAMGILAAGSGAGAALSAVLAQMLIDSYGWQWALRVLGCISFVLGSMAAMTFVPVNLSSYPAHPNRSMPLKWRELLKIPAFFFFYMAVFLYGACWTVIVTFLKDFAESKNISATDAAGLWTYWGISTAIARFSGGIRNTTHMTRIKELSLAFCGLGIISWALAFSWENYPNYTVFVIYQICDGWFTGMIYHLTSLVLQDVLGIENVSLAMGLFFTVTMPTAVGGPPALGFVVDQADGNYAKAFQIIAFIQTISGIFMIFFWKYCRVIIRNREKNGAFTGASASSISLYSSTGFSQKTIQIWASRSMMVSNLNTKPVIIEVE